MYPSWIVIKINEEAIEEKSADEAAIPINPSKMCPALIFAANRNERVINRTEMLIVSVRTRKGLSQSGAPDGRKWATNFLGEKIIPLIINLNHKGSPRESVKRRCLVDLKK